MMLTFEVDGEPVEFRRNYWSGRAELRSGDEVIVLQSPYRLSTQFNVRTKVDWQHRLGEHDVVIEKVRPRMLGGLRANSYTVAVDGVVVAEGTGM